MKSSLGILLLKLVGEIHVNILSETWMKTSKIKTGYVLSKLTDQKMNFKKHRPYSKRMKTGRKHKKCKDKIR